MQNRQKFVSMRILIDEEKGVYNKEDGSLNLNPNSLEIRKNCYVEDSFAEAKAM